MLFFDCDILIFKNPFKYIFPIRPKLLPDEKMFGTKIEMHVDVRFQRESALDYGCGGHEFNSGQMYLRNSAKMVVFYNAMLDKRIEIIEGKHGLEQEYIAGALEKANMTACGLPHSMFTSFCSICHRQSQNFYRKISDIATFHFACFQGLEKVDAMTKALESAIHAKETTLKTFCDVLKQPALK